MKILHIISNESDWARVERVTRYMSEEFEHQFVMSEELGSVKCPVDVIHAHRWFGCGQAGYTYASAKQIPYVVDVAQSDLDSYRKLFVFNKKNAENVLFETARVVFTSPSQEDFLAQHLPSKVANTVFAKSSLLYEPLESSWLENLHIHPPTALVHIKLLYVGPFVEESRLDDMLHAMKKLQKRNYPVALTAVETPEDVVDGRYRQKMLADALKSDCFKTLQTDSFEGLRDIYRSHDILFLPHAETLQRYAEALSQGLPVLYAPNGICDGVFKEGQAGYAVNPKNADDLAKTILNVSDLFGTIEQQIMRLHPLGLFDAKEQARQWEHLYENALR